MDKKTILTGILFIAAFILASCEKEVTCYECKSREMPQVTFCGYTESEMRFVIDWRLKYLNDTLICRGY